MTSVDKVIPGRARAKALGARDVLGARVAADHPTEHAIAPRLHRQVDVAREHVELGVRRWRARRWRAAGEGSCTSGAPGQGTSQARRPKERGELALVGVVARRRRQGVVAVAVDGLAEEHHLARAGVDPAAAPRRRCHSPAGSARARGCTGRRRRSSARRTPSSWSRRRSPARSPPPGARRGNAARRDRRPCAAAGGAPARWASSERRELGDVVGADDQVEMAHPSRRSCSPSCWATQPATASTISGRARFKGASFPTSLRSFCSAFSRTLQVLKTTRSAASSRFRPRPAVTGRAPPPCGRSRARSSGSRRCGRESLARRRSI